MTAPANRIWAYLHGEMSEEEKSSFEETMQADELLRNAVNQRKSTHRTLEELMPEIDMNLSEESLEDILLSSWESEHPEHIEPLRKKTGARRILLFTGPLAAAAALIILLGLPLQTGPIRWQSTDFGTAPHLRGQVSVGLVHPQTELERIDKLLRLAVERSYLPATESHNKWTIKISFQEMANGALSTEVSAHLKHHPEQALHWNRDFQTLENFRTEIPRFGKQIARDLNTQEN